ncbi:MULTISPECIES: Cof-type HAD-IIB family hydrolase [unclassified Streptococcus]|uniref:Cof-type HAD-IIB family hydrolase n=1 Tax=unclassified Streptococcus TaxID=2608887 RepID=UPI0007350796|nr:MULTISPECIES: Cof-type HAD-IIB family hydrolase [unclassified Streptococcus]OFN57037.1 haloacid dehalogenase [Streptococcus sp. HMSC034B05]PNM84250.1 HAD family hydrolase [Streptococcus sp. FDAARGOS_146]
MTIKMIVTDMDGTLLDEKGEFDRDRLKNILDELDKREIRFVVATGNEIHRMRLLFGDLLERVTLIAANGARIFDKNEILLGTCWSQDLVAQVLSYFEGRERDVHLVVTAENGAFVKMGTIFPMIEKVMTAEMAQEFYRKINFVEALRPDDFPQVLKMSMMVNEQVAVQATRQLNQDFEGTLNAVTSGYGAIDILQKGIHKAWGLKQLMQKWKIQEQDIMAFGDSENDIEMLQLAGISYAMENADPRVKTVANHLAPANTEAGVLTVLENYLRKGESQWLSNY